MLDADPYAAFSSPVDSSPAPAASPGPASAPTAPGTLAQSQDQPAPDINAVIARNARYQQIADTQGADGVIAALKAEGVDPATIDENAIRAGVAAHAAVSTIGVPQKPITATPPPQDPSDPYAAFSSLVDSKPRDTGADAASTSAPAASREAQTPVEGIGGGARNFLESGGDLLNTLTLPVRAPMAALGLPVDYAKDAADLADKLGLSHIDGVAGAIQKGMSLGLLTAGAAAPLAGAEGLTGGIAKALSSTPIADTVVSGVSQGAGENAKEHGAGALGQTAAQLAAGLAGGVVAARGVPHGTAETAPTQAAQIKQAAADENIRILPQDVGSDGVKRATAWAAQTPFGAKTVAQAADNMYGDFRDRVGELAGQTAKPVEVGDAVAARSQQAADRAVQAADRTSGAIRDNLATPVDQTAAGQLIQRNVSRFMDDTAGHSNSGAINNVNATTMAVSGGLSTFISGLLTGHLGLVAGGAATAVGPPLVQRISAETLTSPRLLNWLAKAPAKPNPAAEMAHLSRLTVIAKAEPAIANSVISLQRYLEQRMGAAAAQIPDQAAADHRRDRQ